jgi:hypothetical protein
MQLDVTAQELPALERPTHLYYLATPRIPGVKRFDYEDLERMMQYYVRGLSAVLEAIQPTRSAPPVHVWTPSTIFLDQSAGSIAYTTAKAAMEEFCRRLPSIMNVTVRAPRLPRIATDQTASLIRVDARSPLDVALEALRG